VRAHGGFDVCVEPVLKLGADVLVGVLGAQLLVQLAVVRLLETVISKGSGLCCLTSHALFASVAIVEVRIFEVSTYVAFMSA